MGDQEQDPDQIDVQVLRPAEQMAGVWANYARVSHSEHEFTLDFVRIDQTHKPPTGIVVARVSVSPLFITQLIDALDDNWKKYARKALPREIEGDDREDDQPAA